MSDLVSHLAYLAERINQEYQQAETAIRTGLAHPHLPIGGTRCVV